MAQGGDGAGDGGDAGRGPYAGAPDADGGPYTAAPDARLTELLRADTATAYAALQELRRRHRRAVLGYARLCAASESAARQLAAQTFTEAARETARGVEPLVPLRHHLLLLTARLAAAWARDERSAGLDPGLLLVLNTTGTPEGPLPPLLPAFHTLPSRAQGLLWYAVVDEEREDRTAALLALTPWDVAYDTPHALQAMAQACLRSRLAASDDPHCGDFRRLIEESTRPDTPRHSADLHAHMARCPHCTAAHEDLTALRDTPRTTLAEGLLPWAGTAYTTRRGPQESRTAPLAGTRRAPSRRFLLASAALGVALVPLLFLLRPTDDSPDPDPANAVGTPTSAPQVTVTATATATATVSATPSPSPSATSQSPTPTRTPSPAKRPADPIRRPTPTAHAPDGTYAQVVNTASGRCLDVSGDFDNGTDVVTAPCTSSASQRWRVDTARGVVQSSANPAFCLDTRGSVDKGVGIWQCASLDGDHGENLRFAVDSDGVIRPAIAIETGLTPDGGGELALEPLTGGAEQRWRAGAR
ncbi:ricin-type beta-trefoil lectin domain protein [Streptomyces sp. NPDC051636]|uniref:ricin-type beta-trefoil lectin domain protein n=1 Tax=Streptomyces sp. NPDC051636 TaxID=3365663 RepID=UPI0037BD89C1